MTKVRRSRVTRPLRAWAGDSPSRQFLVWLLRGVASLAVLAIAIAISWYILTPWMIDGVTDQFMQR